MDLWRRAVKSAITNMALNAGCICILAVVQAGGVHVEYDTPDGGRVVVEIAHH